MRWLLFALAGLVALAGCIGTDGPTADEDQPTEIDPQVSDRPDEGPPTHPDPDGDGSLENASEGGFSMTHVPPGDYETDVDGPSRPLEEGPYEVAKQRVVEIESPIDGATIQVGVVLPDVPEGTEVPVIGVASIYFRTNLTDVDLSSQPRLERYVDNHLPHGYAVAAIPVRGTAGNGGCLTMGGYPETVDLNRAITWLGEADFSNGNVALTGISYEGWTAWEAAATGNPYLETIVPVAGVTDWHEYLYPNGTTRPLGAGGANALIWAPSIPQRNDEPPSQSAARKQLASALCPEAIEGLAAAGYSSATGEHDPRGYWAERSAREGVLANYTGSVFVVHGLDEMNVRASSAYPWASQLAERGVVVKHWLGQWRHTFPDYHPRWGTTPDARWDYAQTLHNWFAYWLKEDPTRDLGPPVQVQTERGLWRSAWTWPASNATWTECNLAPNGTLAAEPSESTELQPVGPDPGRMLQGNRTLQEQCQTCARFTSAPADEPTVVTGRPRVHVTVTPKSPADGHLSAYLYLEGNGTREMLSWGHIDLRFADGDDRAEPVVPGQPLQVRLSLEPTEGILREGERLRLVVTQGTEESGPDPRDHQDLDTSPAPPTGFLLHTGDGQSTLSFEQPQPPADRFFTPPGS